MEQRVLLSLAAGYLPWISVKCTLVMSPRVTPVQFADTGFCGWYQTCHALWLYNTLDPTANHCSCYYLWVCPIAWKHRISQLTLDVCSMETTGLGSPIASHVYFRWKPQDQHGGRFNSLKSRPLICVIFIYNYIISYNYIYIDISCWWVESGWVPILPFWLVEVGWNPSSSRLKSVFHCRLKPNFTSVLLVGLWQPKTRRRWRTHSFLSSWRRCGVAQMALSAELKNGWVSHQKTGGLSRENGL